MILCSFSNTDYHMAWYEENKLDLFLKANKIDGIELFLHGRYEVPEVLKALSKGIHLSYYPTWLDFYLGDESYFEDFTTEEEVVMAYGGKTPQAMVDNYKKEFELSKELGVDYMVFHVGHVKLKDVFKGEFDYSNEEVLKATAHLVNEIFDQPSEVMLLFENLWWPGLKLTDKKALDGFMAKINYPSKGVMLDLSHLLLTHPSLDSYEKGVAYILEIVEALEDSSDYIKGIHINYSKCYEYLLSLDYENNKKEHKIYDHILASDQHIPFEHEGLKTIIDRINPKYKVIEVKGIDKEDWENNVIKQRNYI